MQLYLTALTDSCFEPLCSYLIQNGYAVKAGSISGKPKMYVQKTSFCLIILDITPNEENKKDLKNIFEFITDFLQNKKYSYFSIILEDNKGAARFNAGQVFETTKEEKELI